MNRKFRLAFIAPFFVLVFISFIAAAEESIIKMSTTTSTENSGLLDFLLPEFTKDTGIRVKVFAKGTGAAIRDGMDGNVDIVFVHDRAREDSFIKDGYGAYRLDVMHNDFILIGPGTDPAGIKGMDVPDALKKIADSGSLFISRGDDSGTHSKELELWRLAGIRLERKKSETDGKKESSVAEYVYPARLSGRYISIGQGMGKTLTFAEEKQAYTLSDRGTYLEYKYGRPQGLDLGILCEGDDGLLNPYGVIPVNPEKYPDVNFRDADALARWLVSEKGQKLIAAYRIQGRQAFFSDAIKNRSEKTATDKNQIDK